tara:strand:- start:95 stop:772 length:678 start_codon:yes stop_codon:yes gene_type:complete
MSNLGAPVTVIDKLIVKSGAFGILCVDANGLCLGHRGKFGSNSIESSGLYTNLIRLASTLSHGSDSEPTDVSKLKNIESIDANDSDSNSITDNDNANENDKDNDDNNNNNNDNNNDNDNDNDNDDNNANGKGSGNSSATIDDNNNDSNNKDSSNNNNGKSADHHNDDDDDESNSPSKKTKRNQTTNQKLKHRRSGPIVTIETNCGRMLVKEHDSLVVVLKFKHKE